MSAPHSVDWLLIKAEYLKDAMITLDSIAERYSVNYSYLREVAAKEKWLEERQKIQQLASNKLAEKLPETIAEVKLRHARIARIMQNRAMRNLHDGTLQPKSYQDLRTAIQLEREALGINEKVTIDVNYEKFKQFSFIFDLSDEELKRFMNSFTEKDANSTTDS